MTVTFPPRRMISISKETTTFAQTAHVEKEEATFEDIARKNNIANPDMIYPGQTLQVPGRSTGNFSASARDIHLVDGGRVLEAELVDTRGQWHRRRIDLDERIGNSDGHLRFV
ncbi:putative carbohydrate-binding module family 50 protein [Daldinia childiae]|uniref:putative carbohydrate-binding module family 50 protein n=1 Tax=Daldinia childiae TaxID=326645 RepID=UPI0014467E66|nr:putative carbohydrate-binding module family 50 protein [Daldinia childiae]KAF3061566.1 putative carbohydrate-binding module family 50 protein [Daldinia childiae]